MGRKNWLFANTEGGAQSSAIVYSLIETARENNLDPYRYLVHVLSKAPSMAVADRETKKTTQHVAGQNRRGEKNR